MCALAHLAAHHDVVNAIGHGHELDAGGGTVHDVDKGAVLAFIVHRAGFAAFDAGIKHIAAFGGDLRINGQDVSAIIKIQRFEQALTCAGEV